MLGVLFAMGDMNTEKLYRVFGTIQALERSLVSGEQAVASKLIAPRLRVNIAEQYRVLGHMRQVAKQLEFQVGMTSQEEESRLLKIFYSLHHMLKPEIDETIREIGEMNNWLVEMETMMVQ